MATRRLPPQLWLAVAVGAATPAGGLAAGVPAQASAAPLMTAVPTVGVSEGTQIAVRLSGWGDLPSVDLYQCAPGAQAIEDCAVEATQVTVPLDFGAGEATFTARVLFSPIECHKDKPCSLAAVADASDMSNNKVETTLTFRDNGGVDRPSSSTTSTTGSSDDRVEVRP